MQSPAAFISYAHRDDEAYGGRISALRRQLALVVGAAMGRDFEIFQDREGIAWGQHWPSRLDEALQQAFVLIPILTPSYFNSGPCRAKLEKFLELERQNGRNDLILPIYFRTARVLQDKSDTLAAILSQRQYRDWRNLRHVPINSPDIMWEIDRLADDIEATIHRQIKATLSEPALAPPNPVVLGLDPRTHVPGPFRQTRRLEGVENNLLARSTGLSESLTGKAGSRVEPEGDSRNRIAERLVPICDPAPDAPPGTIFKDIDEPWCPEMVVIPAGRFLMGSAENEEGRDDDEGSQHQVAFARPFALGRYPVTFAEYDHFCAATGREKARDWDWGRGRRPVIEVSWEDAEAYCQWLSEFMNRTYRLPSEAEWEYACRAGTTTPFWTGATITTDQANYDGNYTYGHGAKGQDRNQTTPVDAFPANPWGLHDMHGNVWEWCADRWHESYEGAPRDGSMWLEGRQTLRVVRGGSWFLRPENLRSAYRDWVVPRLRFDVLGFRVSRMLTA